MAININRYVNVTSSVGAAAQLTTRELILRIFTANQLLPTGTNLEFTTLEEVGDYFGTSSTEYLRAVPYFGWISKTATRAHKISYARWANPASAPQVFGGSSHASLATLAAINNGTLGITIGADVNTFTGLDFTGAASLDAVAAILQTAVRTKIGTMWTSATVTYDATRSSFVLTGGSAIAATISVQQGVGGTPIGTLLLWLSGEAIYSNGAALQSVTQVLDASFAASDNFGSFVFIPTLSIDELEEAAIWNDEKDYLFMFTAPVITANAETYSTALSTYRGVGLTLSDYANQYPEQIPATILAATDYFQPNSVQNYMFQIFPGTTAGVTTDAVADLLDGYRVNYYGATQEAGQTVSFYQRGYLFGQASDALDMNTYCNEIWLKNYATVTLMNLFLAVNKISANAQGRGQILATLQSVINAALNNGVISVGKDLTPAQIAYITQVSNDPRAWYQVKSVGYWVDCVIALDTDSGDYIATYTLIYSKDDVVRKVDGRHILI